MQCLRAVLLSLLVVVTGCLTTPGHDRVFSKEWADHHRHQDEISARAKRVRERDPDPGGQLGADRKHLTEGQPKTRGNSGIRLGGRSGLGGILHRDGGIIQYKLEW